MNPGQSGLGWITEKTRSTTHIQHDTRPYPKIIHHLPIRPTRHVELLVRERNALQQLGVECRHVIRPVVEYVTRLCEHHPVVDTGDGRSLCADVDDTSARETRSERGADRLLRGS